MTKGYNLPCKYVIHTVGPIVHGMLSETLRADLRSCYQACLAAAMEHGIRTIAFCCISTGEFRFPNKEAAKIAWKTIQDCLKGHHDKFDRIILNVFKECDYDVYQELLSNEGGVTLLTK